ncbi:MAG: hypothetical protein JWO77_59 [Ilumatobacteraceae bacterium]|nr:hypothetical protein [Ilumatobacteraceae bacterium]
MITEEASGGPAAGSQPFPWRGGIVFGAALLWGYGVGSLIAVVLFISWHRRATSRLDARLMQVGLGLGVAGLVATVLSIAVLTGTQSS